MNDNETPKKQKETILNFHLRCLKNYKDRMPLLCPTYFISKMPKIIYLFI